jgi:hypothetical protein
MLAVGVDWFCYGYDNLSIMKYRPAVRQTTDESERLSIPKRPQFRSIFKTAQISATSTISIRKGRRYCATTFHEQVVRVQSTFGSETAGRLSGTLGFSSYHRNYQTVGEEILAPDTIQNTFAGFGYEELHYNPV